MSAATSTILAGVGLAAGVGTSIAGGLSASSSAEDQARAAEKSSAAAIAEQRRQYDQSRLDLTPWRNVGSAAIYKLASLMGLSVPGAPGSTTAATGANRFSANGATPLGPTLNDGGPGQRGIGREPIDPTDLQALRNRFQVGSSTNQPNPTNDPEFGSLNRDFSLADWEKDPGYQARLDEGYKGLERTAAARGRLNSGSEDKALVRFGQDYASNEFGNAFNRYNINQTNRFNRFASLAQGGQQTSLALADLGQRSADNIGAITIGGATSAAAARAAGSSALAQSLNGIPGSFMNWYYLNRLNSQGSSGGGDPTIFEV